MYRRSLVLVCMILTWPASVEALRKLVTMSSLRQGDKDTVAEEEPTSDMVNETVLHSTDDPWMTTHDIDALESEVVHHPVHNEENCESCIEGDISRPILDDETVDNLSTSALIELMQTNETLRTGASGKAWPHGIVYYKWKDNIHPDAKSVTELAMKIWEHKSCVKFRLADMTDCHRSRRKQDAECFPVNMGSDEDGCHAHAGFHKAEWQNYNLGDNCHYVGTALHELGHSLGLSHEHERDGRDKYVRANMDNIVEKWQRWFKVTSWRSQELKSLPYDLSSIMHYDAWAFAKKKDYHDDTTKSIEVIEKDSFGNCKIGQRTSLSIGDVVTVTTLYGCNTNYCTDYSTKCAGTRKHCPQSGTKGKYDKWMSRNCKATCGLCTCEDEEDSAKCAGFVKKNMCPHQDGGSKGNRKWMRQNCAKSCGVCGPTDLSCQDADCIQGWSGCRKCKDYAKGQKSSKGKLYCDASNVQMSCPRSCGTCPAQVYC